MKFGKGLLKKKLNGELVYEGFFKEDKFNGNGTLFLNNGYVYEGSFFNGKKQGKGCLYSNDRKFIYEGEWADDEKEGYGKEIFPDGTRFEGEFEKGKKNGIGNDSFKIIKSIKKKFNLIFNKIYSHKKYHFAK